MEVLITILKEGESGIKDYSIAADPNINSAASLEMAISNEISFIESGSYLINQLNKTKASAIIIPSEDKVFNYIFNSNIDWIISNNPRIAFAEVLELLYPKPIIKKGIHQSAVIGKGVVLGNEISIGPNVCIEEGVQVGEKTVIHPGVVIYNNSTIGANNELHANCVIHANTQLGDNCIINSNAVIGSEGFGFIPTNNGWRKMPQTGKVILENNVDEEVSNDLKEFGVDSDAPDLFSSETESSSSEELLSSDQDEEEDDLEIPAFLRRQKN